MADTCSPEEVDLLLTWLSGIQPDAPVIRLIQEELAAPVPASQIGEDIRQRLENRLQQILDADIPAMEDMADISGEDIVEINREDIAGHRRRRLFGHSWRYAAAVVLLIAGGGTWFLLFRTHISPPAAVAPARYYKNDVAPGGNKATLTMSNGATILLDSAQNGVLARQGNVKVLKLNNGLLAYNGSPAKAGSPGTPQYNTISTPRGGQYRVVLPDETVVWLNAASSLTFPVAVTGKDRTVTLTGEGYFEVASNAKAPFIVKVAGQEVRVLGTHFDINAYKDEPGIKTTLVEGSVQVAHLAGDAVLTGSVIVKPGEQATVNADQPVIRLGKVNVKDVIAWKDGFFNFHNDDVQAIMRQLSRWYDVDVKYEGTLVPQNFTGKIDRTLSLVQVLKILDQTRVHFKIEEDKRIIILP
jgi:transmembrane sensor